MRGNRMTLSTCVFGVDLGRVERFSPRLGAVFSSSRAAPGDGLVERMLAARVKPTVLARVAACGVGKG